MSFRLVWLDTTSLVRRYTSSFRPLRGHQSDGHELAGPAQVLCKVPGGPTQKAVENDDRGGEEDVVIQDILQSGADGHSQQSADQAEQRGL